MTAPRKAHFATAAALAVLLGVVAFRQAGWRLPAFTKVEQKREATPQDAIYAMLDAARDGNIAAYLACYTGQMETALRQAIAEKTEAGFSAYLKETNAPLKGVAVMAPETLSGREVKVRVEFVYQDRNEAQFMYLEKTGGAWKIARLDAAERARTLVPYGTPVK